MIFYTGLIQSGPPTTYRAYNPSYLQYLFSAIYKGYPFQFHSIYSNRGAHLVATSFYLNLVTFCQWVDNDGIWMGIWWNWNRKSQRFTLETDNFGLIPPSSESPEGKTLNREAFSDFFVTAPWLLKRGRRMGQQKGKWIMFSYVFCVFGQLP